MNTSDIKANIEYICHVLHETVGLSSFLYDKNLQIAESTSECENHMRNFFLLNNDIVFEDIFSTNDTSPIFYSDSMYLNWFIQPLAGHDAFILIGPSFESELTNSSFQKQMDFQKMSVSSKLKFLEMLKLIPVIPYSQFRSYAQMVHFSVFNKTTSTRNYDHPKKEEVLEPIKKAVNLPETHGSRYAEFQLLNHVRHGILHTEEASSKYNHVLGMLSPNNPLRQAQNMMIIGIALICRAAVEGGMNYEAAFSLSDSYIQQIELAKNTTDVYSIYGNAITTYTTEVRKVQQSSYSELTKYTITFIEKTLPNSIDLDKLSAKFGYDKYYISRIFHKDTGKSIANYTLNMKIEEAKSLLLSTQMSVQDISDALCFSSASYFCNSFKKEVGYTPVEFRSIQTDH